MKRCAVKSLTRVPPSLVALLVATQAVAAEPKVVDPAARVRRSDETVRKAMQDELGRSMADLRLGDEPRPYYVAYTVSDFDQASVNATLGAVTLANGYRGRVLRTDLRVGEMGFDNTNFENGPRVETIPLEDDYAALRREMWLRTDEAYKSALETLARKRAAAAGQAAAEDDESVGDFSKEPPRIWRCRSHRAPPIPRRSARPSASCRSILTDFPQIYGSRASGPFHRPPPLRRSDGSWVDDHKRTVRVDVIADTQPDDGMKLRSFVPFAAHEPAGLPPFAEMEKAVRAMAKELVAMRTAPVANSGAAAVLFEGLAAAQLIKLLVAEQLSGTPPPKTASACERRRRSAERAGDQVGAEGGRAHPERRRRSSAGRPARVGRGSSAGTRSTTKGSRRSGCPRSRTAF